MWYYFYHKRAPKTKFTAKYQMFLDYFWRSRFIIKLKKPKKPPKKSRRKSLGWGKKGSPPLPMPKLNFGLVPDSKTWFRLYIRWEPCGNYVQNCRHKNPCISARWNCIGRESKQNLWSFYPPPPIKWLRNTWMVPFFSRRLLILIIRDSITKESTIGVNKKRNSAQKKTSNCFIRRIPKCFIIHLWKKLVKQDLRKINKKYLLHVYKPS